MSRIFRAHWLLPIDRPPLENGWIQIDDGRITATGRGQPPGVAEDLGDVALLPGFVNAHTHLELSWMAGAIPPAESLVEWIRGVMRERSSGPGEGEAARSSAVVAAIEQARSTGTVLVGDVSNTLSTSVPLALMGMDALVFHELLGFNPVDPDGLVRQAWGRVDQLESTRGRSGVDPSVDFSVVAHAPYSVSPALFDAIRLAKRRAPLAVHLAESPEEVEFLRTGRGEFPRLLKDLGVWDDRWQSPQCDPVAYLEHLKYLTPGCLIVHGVHLTVAALERLRDADAVIVTCPRSNEWVGAGIPPVAHFYASGVRVAIGTDSLASVASLNVFDELAALRRIAPEVSAASLLESATRVGADALGRGADFGTLEPRKRAELTAVTVPAATQDVEEYLVSGIDPAAIRVIGHSRAFSH